MLLYVSPAAAQEFQYRLLATNKTSTMEKELNAAASSGFRFETAIGGESAFGGKEVVAVMKRTGGDAERYHYKLLATNKTGTMQKELQSAAREGYIYRAQTVFETAFGGKEVVAILERDSESPVESVEYRLLATSRTSTMDKELADAGSQGFEVLGLTVAETAFGGKELLAILARFTAR
jgi:hypothetical protein